MSRLLRRINRIEAKVPPKPSFHMCIFDKDQIIIDGEFAGIHINNVRDHTDDDIRLWVFLPERGTLPEIDAEQTSGDKSISVI